MPYDRKLAWQGNIIITYIFFAYSTLSLVPSALTREFIESSKTNTHLFKISYIWSRELSFGFTSLLWNINIKQCASRRKFLMLHFSSVSTLVSEMEVLQQQHYNICIYVCNVAWHMCNKISHDNFCEHILVQICQQQYCNLQHHNCFTWLTMAKQHKKLLCTECIECLLLNRFLMAVVMSKYKVAKFSTTPKSHFHMTMLL